METSTAEPAAKSLTGLAWGFRLAYGSPSGDVFGGRPLKSVQKNLYRLQVDGDFRLSLPLTMGLYLNAAPGSLSDDTQRNCDANHVSCNSLDIGIGLHAEYRLLPTLPVDPWIGFGLGYELLSQTVSDDQDSIEVTAKGLELNATIGVDVAIGKLEIGPFLTYQVGRFSSIEYKIDSTLVESGDIGGTTYHEWLLFGLRGRYGFGGG